uniref:Putative secreted protein n=1 Tax=Ixodes ricinus TaxID=34613 RepID=A0A090XB25_IXORI
MKATKLLLILAFHFAAGGFSVTEMSGQEFFDRALQAAVYAYSLDPMEMEFVRDIDSGLASLKIYQLTAHGLSTVHREGANFIWVNNSGASLKIDIAAKNVTVTVLANVTVGFSFLSTTVTIQNRTSSQPPFRFNCISKRKV